jgi:hypothetical protein
MNVLKHQPLDLWRICQKLEDVRDQAASRSLNTPLSAWWAKILTWESCRDDFRIAWEPLDTCDVTHDGDIAEMSTEDLKGRWINLGKHGRVKASSLEAKFHAPDARKEPRNKH